MRVLFWLAYDLLTGCFGVGGGGDWRDLAIRDVELCPQALLQDLGEIDAGALGQVAQPGGQRYIFAHGAQVVCAAVGVQVDIDQGNKLSGAAMRPERRRCGDGAAFVLLADAPETDGVPRHGDAPRDRLALGADGKIGHVDGITPGLFRVQNDGIDKFLCHIENLL